MSTSLPRHLTALALTATLASGCTGDPGGDPGAGPAGGSGNFESGERSRDRGGDRSMGPSAAALPSPLPAPTLDPDGFVAAVDNPWLPLLPGTRWTYRAGDGAREERILVTVTARTRRVAGVDAVVVHDRVRAADGTLLEDTWDWYAQDAAGNVWYLGEDTTAYEDGRASREGSWEAGVDGAQAGLAMPARPRVGQSYPQELLPGEAEDRGEVVALGVAVTVPAGSYPDTVQTRDTTPLEPRLVEHKFYAAGVGLVREETVRGGDEVVELVAFRGP